MNSKTDLHQQLSLRFLVRFSPFDRCERTNRWLRTRALKHIRTSVRIGSNTEYPVIAIACMTANHACGYSCILPMQIHQRCFVTMYWTIWSRMMHHTTVNIVMTSSEVVTTDNVKFFFYDNKLLKENS
jgi:hypothetical protein